MSLGEGEVVLGGASARVRAGALQPQRVGSLEFAVFSVRHPGRGVAEGGGGSGWESFDWKRSPRASDFQLVTREQLTGMPRSGLGSRDEVRVPQEEF